MLLGPKQFLFDVFGDHAESDPNFSAVGAACWSPRFDPLIRTLLATPGATTGSQRIAGGQSNINRVCDGGLTAAAVGRASVLVNGGGYGYAERQAYAPYVFRFRSDSTETAPTSTFKVVRGRTTHVIYVDFTPQRPR
jgi:hypothetical protein